MANVPTENECKAFCLLKYWTCFRALDNPPGFLVSRFFMLLLDYCNVLPGSGTRRISVCLWGRRSLPLLSRALCQRRSSGTATPSTPGAVRPPPIPAVRRDGGPGQ
eukprot:EG_transcript_24215